MENQLIPEFFVSHELNSSCSRRQAIGIWLDLMNAADSLVRARLNQQFGQANLQEQYRIWFADRVAVHRKQVAGVAEKLNSRGNY